MVRGAGAVRVRGEEDPCSQAADAAADREGKAVLFAFVFFLTMPRPFSSKIYLIYELCYVIAKVKHLYHV